MGNYNVLIINTIGVDITDLRNDERITVTEKEEFEQDRDMEGIDIVICGGDRMKYTIQELKGMYPEIPLIASPVESSESTVVSCFRLGVDDYIIPGNCVDIVSRVVTILDNQSVDFDQEKYISHLHKITTNQTTACEEKITEVLEFGCEILNLDIGILTRIDVEKDTQVIEYGVGSDDIVGSKCSLDEAYCKQTIQQEELLTIYDAEVSNDVSDEAYGMWELEAYIGGKIIVKDELYGTVCFADTEKRERVFTGEELAFIDLLIDIVAYELEQSIFINELQETNNKLESFASIVSHDLRNPINVAQGRVDLYRRTGDESNMDIVEDSLDRMMELIDDLLWMSRGGDIRKEDGVSIREVGEAAWGHVSTASAELELVCDDCVVRADESRLRQIFENLFRNSVEHGGGDVTVTVGDLDGCEGFYVEDTGPRVPEDIRDEVFVSGVTSQEDGTGFGLAIVKDIAEAHGWSVVLGEGDGARFEFVFE